MAPTAENVVQVTFLGTMSNGRAHDNVLAFRASGLNGSPDGVPELVEAVRDAWQDNIVGIMALGYTFTGCRFIDLDSAEGATGEVAPDPLKTLLGPLTNPPPPNCSLLVTKVVTGAGRASRNGRMYLWVGNEGSIDAEGDFDPALLPTFQSALDGFLTDIAAVTPTGAAGPIELVVLNWPRDVNGNIPPEAVAAVRPVTALTPQGRIATQRRRLRG